MMETHGSTQTKKPKPQQDKDVSDELLEDDDFDFFALNEGFNRINAQDTTKVPEFTFMSSSDGYVVNTCTQYRKKSMLTEALLLEEGSSQLKVSSPTASEQESLKMNDVEYVTTIVPQSMSTARKKLDSEVAKNLSCEPIVCAEQKSEQESKLVNVQEQKVTQDSSV